MAQTTHIAKDIVIYRLNCTKGRFSAKQPIVLQIHQQFWNFLFKKNPTMAIIIYIIVENPKLVYLQTAILYIFFSLLKLDKVDPLVADPPHANSTTTLLINTPLVMENLILFAYTA